MFGHPAWFRAKRWGWGLVPVAWQGWCYAAVWSLVLVLPFMLLLVRGQAVEAILWLAAMMVLLVWDVRQILRRLQGDAAGSRTG